MKALNEAVISTWVSGSVSPRRSNGRWRILMLSCRILCIHSVSLLFLCGSNRSPAVWLDNFFPPSLWRKTMIQSHLLLLLGLLCFPLFSLITVSRPYTWICHSIKDRLPEVLCYRLTWTCQTLCTQITGLLPHLYSELFFTALLYMGQLSNLQIL